MTDVMTRDAGVVDPFPVGTVSDPVPCNRCGRTIRFAPTIKGRRMPIDAEPVENGEFVIDPETGKIFEHASLQRSMLRAGNPAIELLNSVPRWRSHAETCPASDRRRRR
ncbi:MAG: hypothetical protein AB7V46_15660 [Thermomicrobiales bacterium]